jgi:hypothetical protein
MNYPTSLDDSSSLPNPGATDKTNSPSHAGLHSDENAAIIAVETKLGTGSSTPVANRLMFGTGTGTSAWTQLTSSQLASSLSDETGTGSAVFQTSPTLNTPKVDTIQENTSTNGVTVDGLNIKDGKLNTNDSVVTANITDAAVTNAKLSLTAASWSPTLGNLSGGTLNYALYTEIGNRVFCEFKYTLGGAGMGTGPTITLPVAPAAHYVDNDIISHNVLLSETGAQDYYGLARISQTSDLITLYVQQASSTYLNTANITSTVPFTWGSTDIVRASWSYEKA